MIQKPAFQFQTYIFNNILLSFQKQPPQEMSVNFEPSGVFNIEQKTFDLTLTFFAFDKENTENPFIKINCIGTFKFEEVDVIADIPSFFWKNAVAIMFPYIRGFISSITALANIQPLILPTYNLGELEAPLRENTVAK